MKKYYLSPHFDDAIGSCGGTIYRNTKNGDKINIVTIFAKNPPKNFSSFAQELHILWKLNNPVEQRTKENIEACNKLKVCTINLDFIEAIYRTHNNKHLYPKPNSIFEEIVEEDNKLSNQIFKKLRETINIEDEVYAPAAIGNHVDHILVKHAALYLKNEGYKIKFYKDFSYDGPINMFGGYKTITTKLTKEEIQNKIDSVKCYKSQLKMLFGSEDEINNYYTIDLKGEETYYE